MAGAAMNEPTPNGVVDVTIAFAPADPPMYGTICHWVEGRNRMNEWHAGSPHMDDDVYEVTAPPRDGIIKVKGHDDGCGVWVWNEVGAEDAVLIHPQYWRKGS
jgi:hypothetical protein